MLALFRMGMGLSPMSTPKSFTGRAVQVRALCPWCPHCEHRLGPSPPPPAPVATGGGGAAGGTPSRVMLRGEVDWLGLEVGGIIFFSPTPDFFLSCPDFLFFWAQWGAYLFGAGKKEA